MAPSAYRPPVARSYGSPPPVVFAPPAPDPRVDACADAPTRVVREERPGGNVLVKAVLPGGERIRWLRVADSAALASVGLAGAGLYADRRIPRGRKFATYVGRVLGPQGDEEAWERFERLSFAGDEFPRCCEEALDIMDATSPDILHTWVRNTLLECLERADMLVEIGGAQVDGGHPPAIEIPGLEYPAFCAHLANDPRGTAREPNCVFVGDGLEALRDILRGEEILWDYGAPYHADMDARIRATPAERERRRGRMVEKARGLLRFLRAHNARAAAGAWPDGRTRTDAAPRACELTRTDLAMIDSVGIDADDP
eukprot:jgi/Mesvir1/10373/Mv10573-RA.1